MARRASTLEGRDLPTADDPGVIDLLPGVGCAALEACDARRRLGAAWWHFHDPPLLRATSGDPLPEIVLAVGEADRQRGVGTALIESLVGIAAERSA